MNPDLIPALVISAASSGLTCLLTVSLTRQYLADRRNLRQFFASPLWNHAVLKPIKSFIEDAIEPRIEFIQKEFSFDSPVSKIEEHEDYHTLKELLQRIADSANSAFGERFELSQFEQFVKAVYQLQTELKLTSTVAESLLAPAIDHLLGQRIYAKTVSKIFFVQQNDRVEESRMWPLNSGLRVQQPYGLTIAGENGEILSRAKVKCQ